MVSIARSKSSIKNVTFVSLLNLRFDSIFVLFCFNNRITCSLLLVDCGHHILGINMKWYTQENGVVCLGTIDNQIAQFHVETDVVVHTKIDTELCESHIALIGSFPEDWRSDSNINKKINNTAKHFFGFAEKSNSVAFA